MKERFGLRTIFIPLGAIGMFVALQVIVTAVYSFVLMFVEGARLGIDGMPLELPDIEQLLMSHMNNISSVYSVLVIIAAVIALNVLRGRNINAVRTERQTPGLVISSLLVMAGVTGIVALQMTGIAALGEQIPMIDKIVRDYIELSEAFIGDGNILMIILSTCILVPIAEELIFRGIIQGELRRALPAWAAITIQAVIFALIHGNILQISYVIIPAFILGIVYEWTKSIYIPIALHMLFNFAGSALPELLSYDETALLYFSIVQFALIPVGILAFFYLRAVRKTDPEPLPVVITDNDLMPADMTEAVMTSDREIVWKHKDL